jgi:protein gp37
MNWTPIEWTDLSANPLKYRDAAGKVVWACVHASPGCVRCYSEVLAHRYDRGQAFNVANMAGLTPFLDEKELRRMLTYKPAADRRCFVGDMTDIFGSWVSDDLLDRLFAVFALREDVTWQVLTKRAERMRAYMTTPDRLERVAAIARQVAGDTPDMVVRWPLLNVWLGVSAEDQTRADERIPRLLETPAVTRFVSAEPLIGPVTFKQQNTDGFWPPNAPQPDVAWLRHRDWPDDFQYWTTGVNWVIVGGESGAGARACRVDWIRAIVRQCRAGRVPVFVKQLGSVVEDRNDVGFEGDQPNGWPMATEFEAPGQQYQGDIVRVRLRSRKGADHKEWPHALRVREFPGFGEVRRPA